LDHVLRIASFATESLIDAGRLGWWQFAPFSISKLIDLLLYDSAEHPKKVVWSLSRA
jgi:hypothetical protein